MVSLYLSALFSDYSTTKEFCQPMFHSADFDDTNNFSIDEENSFAFFKRPFNGALIAFLYLKLKQTLRHPTTRYNSPCSMNIGCNTVAGKVKEANRRT